jgi:hypothetical protein
MRESVGAMKKFPKWKKFVRALGSDISCNCLVLIFLPFATPRKLNENMNRFISLFALQPLEPSNGSQNDVFDMSSTDFFAVSGRKLTLTPPPLQRPWESWTHIAGRAEIISHWMAPMAAAQTLYWFKTFTKQK